MKRKTITIKKWAVRAMMTVGSALGIVACNHGKMSAPPECVYGPPPEDTIIEVIEDVYEPPAMLDGEDTVMIDPDMDEPVVKEE